MIFQLLLIVCHFEINKAFDPTKHRNWNLLDHETCGQVNIDRIIGGKNASLGQMPWLVRIGYVSTSSGAEISYRCGAVILNEHTILTAAHCVDNLPNDVKVASFRIGEYNSETNPDCVKNVCANPVQDIKPKEIITHKEYNKIPFKHDIALIRLHTPIKRNSYALPICLIHGSLMTRNLINETVEVGGWGIYDIENPKNSVILQVVELLVVDDSQCREIYKRHAAVGDTQICVGGIKGKDSCGGDSGGPLVMLDALDNEPPKYYVIGIVSFGSKRCGISTMPGIYTKISSYMSWILDNLKTNTVDYKVV